jgi:hypothetical protein
MNVLGTLEPGALRSMLRRLTIAACLLGGAGVLIALALSQPWIALGIALGVIGGFLNLRSVDRQVSTTDVDPEASTKALRRRVGSRSIARLGVITAVVVALLLVYAPLGLGIVVGLVLFQLAFVFNVIQVMVARGGEE